MRLLFALTLCCLSFPALRAQQPPEQAVKPSSKPAPPPPTGHITGTVFCADTHRPARGAVIMLQAKPSDNENGGNDQMTRVSMDGHYSLDRVSPGEYAVTAVLPGYINPFDGLTIDISDRGDLQNELWKRESAQGTITVRESSSSKFDIELKRGAAVTGRVLYSDGAPATQVSIDVQPVTANRGKDTSSGDRFDLGAMLRTTLSRQSFTTDDEGNFRVSGLSGGTYRIVATHPSVNINPGDRERVSALGISMDPLAIRVYAGDTLRMKQARTYELRGGDVLSGITITIPVEAFHVVSGRVSALDGRSLNTASVALEDPSDDTFAMSTDLQPDGSFRFPSIPAGTYTLISKNARITETLMRDQPGGQPYPDTVARSAFADSAQPLIVKDADLTDVNISVKEVPLPPDTDKPNPNPPEVPAQAVQPQ